MRLHEVGVKGRRYVSLFFAASCRVPSLLLLLSWLYHVMHMLICSRTHLFDDRARAHLSAEQTCRISWLRRESRDARARASSGAGGTASSGRTTDYKASKVLLLLLAGASPKKPMNVFPVQPEGFKNDQARAGGGSRISLRRILSMIVSGPSDDEMRLSFGLL
jgi:hypothetical protein